MSKLIPIDFEFNHTSEKFLNLVCCSFMTGGQIFPHWLHKDIEAKVNLKKILLSYRDAGHIFLAFNVEAEARSFIALGVDPTKCKWIDLQAEYKMLLNHSHTYMYGKQLIDGKIVYTSPPKNKWRSTEEERMASNNSKPKKNLAACLFKMLGVKIDTDHKNKMRDLIISTPSKFSRFEKRDVQKYCDSDVIHLQKALHAVRMSYKDMVDASDKVTVDEMLWRGETSARTALITSHGYPINHAKVKKFSENIPALLKELCEDINSQFDTPIFRWNNARQSYSMHQKPVRDWIDQSEYKGRWVLTDKKAYSLSLDAWAKHFSYRHDYPREFLPAQMLRFLKIRQSLNGFLPKAKNAKNKTTFFDSVGSDGRVRPYLNPYGAQSARYQPKATGFIPLKAAWMRSLIEPAKGKACCGIDYGSQEFLISALMSEDKNMLAAYNSGDVYLYFAKLAGAVPVDGTKEEYKAQRNLFKATTLGISYSMGSQALANKLSADTGKVHTLEDAEDLITKFDRAYPKYTEFVEQIREGYKTAKSGASGYMKFSDGWMMFGDNDNKRSVSNVPIQQMGSAILRKAIQLAQDKGLKVIFPLHDALYIEYDSNDLTAVDTLAECMIEAFGYYFDESNKKVARQSIRLDANVWSQDYADGDLLTPNKITCKSQSIYIDERSAAEYERFKKYFH